MDDRFYESYVGGKKVTIPRRYEDLECMKPGAQGFVFGAYDRITQQKVVIKKLNYPFTDIISAKRAYREFEILTLVNHRNIIKLLNAYTPQNRHTELSDIYLVTERMESDLLRTIRQEHGHKTISYLLYQILCGIHHLHKAGIIHRDLKPNNIAANSNCELKILDFGLARTEDKLMMTPYVSTRYYRAPEVILEFWYDSTIDVWSIGCIFAEFIKKQILFPGRDDIDQWTKIIKLVGSPDPDFIASLQPKVRDYVQKLPRYPSIPWDVIFPDDIFPPMDESKRTAEHARDLLSKMLVIDPRHRITVQEALKHPYVKLWYKAEEIEGQTLKSYDSNVETSNRSIDEWKRLIFEKVKEYEATHDIIGDHSDSVDVSSGNP